MTMREWLTPAELAGLALPGLPTSVRGIQRIATEQGWAAARTAAGEPLTRRRNGKGGGWEYHRTLLPSAAQARLVAMAEQPTEPTGTKLRDQVSREDAWTLYADLPDKAKERAKDRLAVIDAVEQLELGRTTRSAAVAIVARQKGVSARSIFNWLDLVVGVERTDRVAYLVPRYTGGVATAECPDEGWEILKADFLRPEGPPAFSACFERLERVAKQRAWRLPSAKTLQRRMDAEVAPEVQCLAREGLEALQRHYPPQRRDRSVFAAMEAVNADGHTFDVFVRWPGEQLPVRVVMVGIQDLRSGMILSWRIDRSESAELVRLAFGDMVERYGIPQHAYLDNGRAFASKWLTGQMQHRHRFKIKAEEPRGILTMLGVTVHWVTPYHGQAKPIERAWKDLCETIARHPACAGAYTGNNPMAKPENYGNRAIPLTEFKALVDQEIRAHNARPKRRTAVCGGRQSFQQAFEESYETAPVQLATAEQRRLWLLAAENLTGNRTDGHIALMGNRYWSEEVGRLAGKPLTVRFDPQNLHESVHVYLRDGRYVGTARCIADVGFADVDAARDFARERKTYLRASKEALAAQRRMTPAQVADVLPPLPEETAPERNVIRLTQASQRPAPAQQLDDDGPRIALGSTLAVLSADRKRRQI